MKKLQDKVCIITGAGGSLGHAATQLFLEHGAKVLMVDADKAALSAAVETIGAPAETLDSMVADVTQAADTQAYINRAIQKWGRLDVVFGNAGINGVIAPIADYPDDVFDRVMAVNVRGCFLACKYALPVIERGGSIVLTSSVVGVTADPGICAYATSKHALIGLMRVAAKEAAPRGVRVNVIAPGPVSNEFQADIERRLSEVVGQDATKMLDSKIPLGRHGQPGEIARGVLYLASEDSSFTTGTVLMADGGMHI